MRHLHDKVTVLESRTAPPKEDVNVDAAGANGFVAPLLMMGNDTLMIGNGPAYGFFFFFFFNML
jgi:hypothetical protein